MRRRPPSGRLTLLDFLDVALLGSITLSAGVSLVTPVDIEGPPPEAGPTGGAPVVFVRALAALSETWEALGVLLVLSGTAMLLVGPLWVFVVQPLGRRGYP
jgi:hypothetical protein